MAKPKLSDEELEVQRREVAELRKVADSLGLEIHPRMKADTLRQMIVDKEQQQFHEQQVTAARDKEVAKVKDKRIEADRMKTEDELVAYIQTYINRGVTISFNGDDTWTMRYGKKEDSGHMTISQQAIKTAAERIITGQAPRGYANDDGKVVLSA